MKVKQKILDLIDVPEMRMDIAREIRCGEQAVQVHIRKNRNNGRMTKMDFLQAISKVTGIPIDEILEAQSIKEPQS